jgi:salicylate hydroxylase
MTNSQDDTIHIAIIGGGIAGLALAIGLLKHPHISFHVYESVPCHADVGAGLALHKNALAAMDLIDSRIKMAYFRRALAMASEEEEEMTTEVMLAEGPHAGEVVAELGRAKGRRTIARSELLEELLKLIPPDMISFGKKLVELSHLPGEKVYMRFADGTEKTADGLIGADGVRSLTRRHILEAVRPGQRPQNPEGWQVHARQVPMELAMKTVDSRWRRTVPILCGPQGHVNMMPLHRGKTLSILVVTRAGVASDGSPQPFETRRFDSYRDDVRAAVKVSICFDLPLHG